MPKETWEPCVILSNNNHVPDYILICCIYYESHTAADKIM